jgi:hypothetical protein
MYVITGNLIIDSILWSMVGAASFVGIGKILYVPNNYIRVLTFIGALSGAHVAYTQKSLCESMFDW